MSAAAPFRCACRHCRRRRRRRLSSMWSLFLANALVRIVAVRGRVYSTGS